jgi:hypothetical protein
LLEKARCLAHARRPEEHHVLRTLDEGKARQFHDLLVRCAGGEREIVLIESFDGREAGNPCEHLAGPRPPRLALGCQHLPSTKSVNEMRFSAAFCASAVYCAAIPPSRSSLHSSITR